MASLSCYANHVQQYLSAILNRGRIGLSPGSVKISNGMPSCPPYSENALCDRFKITVPYAGHSVSWDVMFYSKRPEIAPDLIFSDENFQIELEQINALCEWDCEKAEGLLDVVRQVLEIYGMQQTVQLSKHSRVHFEYTSLLQQEGFSDKDVEVFLSPKTRGPVSFLIRLPVNFANLPPLLTHENPDEDSVLLLVTFQTPEGSRVTPQLFLSPKVEHAVGGAQEWKLPNLTTDGCLMDYVPILVDILDVKIKQVAENFKSRKEYVATFLAHLEGSVLEYDVESFTKMCFLLEHNGFYFVLLIELSSTFPTEKPSLTFQSIYHKAGSKPFSITVDYPYSPRWSTHEMFYRSKSFILEYAPVFQMSMKPRLKI